MTDYRLLALLDTLYPQPNHDDLDFVPRLAARNRVYAAMKEVAAAGFSIISGTPTETPEMQRYLERESVRLLITINPRLFADAVALRMVIGEAYDWAIKKNSAYEADAERARRRWRQASVPKLHRELRQAQSILKRAYHD